MLLQIHCYIEKVKIEPLPSPFTFSDFLINFRITKISDREVLELDAKKSIDVSEFVPEEGEDRDKFSTKVLNKYRAEMQRIALYLEGFLAAYYPQKPIEFDISHVMVNVSPETQEERVLFDEDKVMRGVGDIHVLNPPGTIYEWGEGFQEKVENSSEYLPFLSFFSQALRAQSRHEQEIAFFLLFKIIEGYYGDGSPNVEIALRRRATDIEQHLPPDDLLKNSVVSILGNNLGLPSKAQSGEVEDLISDLVLLRHKLFHFNQRVQVQHFNTDIKPDLSNINRCLFYICIRIIRKELLGG